MPLLVDPAVLLMHGPTGGPHLVRSARDRLHLPLLPEQDVRESVLVGPVLARPPGPPFPKPGTGRSSPRRDSARTARSRAWYSASTRRMTPWRVCLIVVMAPSTKGVGARPKRPHLSTFGGVRDLGLGHRHGRLRLRLPEIAPFLQGPSMDRTEA
jgi:hypothetical protein